MGLLGFARDLPKVSENDKARKVRKKGKNNIIYLRLRLKVIATHLNWVLCPTSIFYIYYYYEMIEEVKC